MVKFLTDSSDMGSHPEYYQPERFPVLADLPKASMIPAGQEPSRRLGQLEMPRGRLELKRIGDMLAWAGGLATQQVMGRGGGRAVSRVREEICFAATHFFHYPSVKIARFLEVSPSGVTRMLRRGQKMLTDKRKLHRIKALMMEG